MTKTEWMWNILMEIIEKNNSLEKMDGITGQQEWIPVGCVPPSLEVSLYREVYLKRSYDNETEQPSPPPLPRHRPWNGSDPLQKEHGTGQPNKKWHHPFPPRWAEWQTILKTWPCRNFLGGGDEFVLTFAAFRVGL